MLKSGILNPRILSLLARMRHTNTLVIADRGFPSWPNMEIVDISLVDDVPTVLQVFRAIRAAAVIGRVFMAKEFLRENSRAARDVVERACGDVKLMHEPHVRMKKRVPGAVGIIRTGDTIQYANMILESA
jgi:D-ribose pyranase